MIKVRPAQERGSASMGWLQSRHSFSFGGYHDPKHMGFGPLRVINEDHVAAGAGFPTHGHENMEIISYVLAGGLEHQDSTGGGTIIRPGDVQRMTAGAGVRHSEFNASSTDPVHFLQIWIMPDTDGLSPGYEQKHFAMDERRNALRLIGARDGRDGALTVHQDVDVYAGLLGAQPVVHDTHTDRLIWVQVARGALSVDGERLSAGDGAAIRNVSAITFSDGDDAEVLVFDMAA